MDLAAAPKLELFLKLDTLVIQLFHSRPHFSTVCPHYFPEHKGNNRSLIWIRSFSLIRSAYET